MKQSSKRILALLAAGVAGFAFAGAAVAASAQTSTATQAAQPGAAIKVIVDVGDQDEALRLPATFAWKAAIEHALKKQGFNDVTQMGANYTSTNLSATRGRVPDVVVGPSQLIGTAVRFGYVPVAGEDTRTKAVLVTLADSNITSFDQAKGARLGLPTQDSIVDYLMRGEVNAANTTLKRHFKSAYESRFQDALLICMTMGSCDIVGVEKATFDRWVKGGAKVKTVMASQEVPGLAIAVKEGSKINVDMLRADMAESMAAAPAGVATKLSSINKTEFNYVSTLGYFTPRALAGATVVDAKTVQAMLDAKKARYIDTRNDAEFAEAHVPGATLIPYVEKSLKDPDFDSKVDSFNVASLGADKNAVLVFGCNGPECWKSHKASIAAIKAGYTNVNWFRGGVPEWRGAGLPVETGTN